MKKILLHTLFFTSIFLGVFIIPTNILASSESDELFGLSFDDLMSKRVHAGSLLFMSNYEKPAMVTTISADDIRYTPHRNIYDLLETYVPGAYFMNHYDLPSFGVRGIISDRNNKVLLMVNGRVANQKARVGALSELENWALGDIERIEIIRGAGSVTYGPGAISCVINIITKTRETNDASDIRVNYNYPYNSQGISGKMSHRITDDISMFAYFSIRKTEGYSPEIAYSIMNNDWEPSTRGFQEYYSDYFNIPQKKLHLQFDIYENYKLWIRYTNSGSNTNAAYYKNFYQTALDSNNYQILAGPNNSLQVKNEHFYITLENEYAIDENFSLSSSLSWDSENNARTQGYYASWIVSDAPDDRILKELLDHQSVRNMYNNFSESELNGNFILRGSLTDNVRLAAGTTLSYNSWGSPWFEDANQIRMGDHSNIISGTDSPIYGNRLYFGVDSADAIFVGNGWSTFMYSFFGEVELKLDEQFKLLLSSRLDKDSYSAFLFSPKLAAIYNLDDENTIKLIAQQSNRMNTAEELFLENRSGILSTPEKLNTVELIYSTTEFDKILFESSFYYNNIDILSWYDPDRTIRTTGNLSMLGIEMELKYSTSIWSIGLNHSYTKLLKWELADNVQTSGISYSDYKFKFLGNEINGVGNNLNNWSNNSTKLYTNLNLLDKKLILHLNSRMFWGFEGAKDGLELAEQVSKGTPSEEKVKKILDVMRNNSFYEFDFRLNASLMYRFLPSTVFSVHVMNITDFGNNYRYKYEAGNKTDEFLFRMGVLEEPLTVGLQFTYEF
jgi:outer membrane receptor protein involved in Fe transport